ncbi:16S rRNA (guanine(527)-N(7))-methyltransferase RsmG [Bacillaceae bacterium SIJ1]|uniref:16S rRNA (guanine(527)-N(7))-methyltransferase RsmG n=1 Tax=Litoribacterium kuwaitense TaxID=1398745 RepID=UPI0013EAB8F6|nr:16S rRNA (guanine(527)-N(7))-methyltransferase RsmG [Litoribacterium kuwaitense]NGP45203.1 16S rRNA (guanine(527)-N(7))-methyltransferase RsmG [Litoribacterium kuwaitense]
MSERTIDQLVGELGLSLTSHQLQQFQTYQSVLLEWNKKMNLTSITEEEEIAEKHFYDSLTPSRYIDFSSIDSLCDVGSGAGFPGVPLKICYPDLQLTIVDSLQKRITFLNHVCTELGLQNVALFHDRAENFGKKAGFRESFDVVTSRAVARMSVLSEFCLPLVKKGGCFVALKGARGNEELEESQAAISMLGGDEAVVHELLLPVEKSTRTIVTVAKKRVTPKKYPRKAGVPSRSPLE